MKTFEVQMRIGGHEYKAEWEDNPTTRRLRDLLPLQLEMEDLDHVEKYFYFDPQEIQLPTDPRERKLLAVGELVLFEKNCLQLFYQPCRSTFRYTTIGQIIEPKNLERYAGRNQVMVEIRR